MSESLPVTTKNSKTCDKVIATVRDLDLLHADEHTVVLINKIEELGLSIQKYKVTIKRKL